MSEHEERRAAPRHDLRIPARLWVGDEMVEAETIDISRDAVLIGGEDFPSGEEVHIEIELAELGWQRLSADVVRRHESGVNGAFLAATFAEAAAGGGREAIQAFLKRHLK